MAVELDELKLTVTLDDQASDQLGNLQRALSGIVTAATPAQQGLKQLGQNLRDAGQHAHSLHGSLGGMAARGGFIGGFFFEVGRNVEQMATSFAKATLDIKAYADAMVSLELSASRASTSAAQFQRTVADMRASGIGAAEAAKNIQGFSDALGDLQREQSRVRENLFAGLRGAEFEDMRRLLQRIQTSDKATALDEIKKFGQDIRTYWTSQGQAERGARAEREFYAQLGVPDIDRLREKLQTVTPELQRMYAMRMGSAQAYQTAVEKTTGNWERSVRSVQATAFRVLPIRESAEAIAQFSEDISRWFESWEDSIGAANDELVKIETSESGFWFDVFQKLGIAGTRTRGQEEREQGTTFEEQGPAKPATFDERFPQGQPTWRIPTPGAPAPTPGGGAAQFVGGGGLDDAGVAGPGSQVGGIPDIGKLLPGGGGGGGPPEIGPASGLSLDERMQRAGVPLSENILDLRAGGGGDEYDLNTEQIRLLATEVGRVNDILIPQAMKALIGGDTFHNAPMGGAAGESNPIRIPASVAQPGGGAAAEARDPATLRPWRTGDPVTGAYKGRPYPFLNPAAATPLPPRAGSETYSGVSEGKGVASWFGQGQGWGDKPSMDRPGSNALRVPEHLQGISLSSPETLGQFFYVTDPSTGLTHVRQQTDAGPGVRTQKFLDVSVAAAQREGYDKKSFEAMQARVERGELQPWEVRNTGFGTQGGSTRPAPSGAIPTVGTQNITRLPGGGATLPSGMDVEFNPFQQSGGPARSTLDLPSGGGGSFGGGGATGGDGRSASLMGGGFASERAGEDLGRPGDVSAMQSAMESPIIAPQFKGRMSQGEDLQPLGGVEVASPQGSRFDASIASARGSRLDLAQSNLDTDIIDQAASQRVEVNQTGRLSVNVNAPEGTTVNAEGSGVFNRTETSREIPAF